MYDVSLLEVGGARVCVEDHYDPRGSGYKKPASCRLDAERKIKEAFDSGKYSYMRIFVTSFFAEGNGNTIMTAPAFLSGYEENRWNDLIGTMSVSCIKDTMTKPMLTYTACKSCSTVPMVRWIEDNIEDLLEGIKKRAHGEINVTFYEKDPVKFNSYDNEMEHHSFVNVLYHMIPRKTSYGKWLMVPEAYTLEMMDDRYFQGSIEATRK